MRFNIEVIRGKFPVLRMLNGAVTQWALRSEIMKTYANKSQEVRGRSADNAASRKACGGASAFQFADHRSEAHRLRELQEITDKSPQVKQSRTIQAMIEK